MAKPKKSKRKVLKDNAEKVLGPFRDILSEKEIQLCLLTVRRVPVTEIERQIGAYDGYYYRAVKKRAIKRLIAQLDNRFLEKLAEHDAEERINAIADADQQLAAIVRSGSHKVRNFADALNAIEITYKRYGINLDKPAETPGQQTAQQVEATQVHLNSGFPEGQSVYISKWIREQYGIIDPASEAIDAEFEGQPDHVFAGSLEEGAAAANDAMERRGRDKSRDASPCGSCGKHTP